MRAIQNHRNPPKADFEGLFILFAIAAKLVVEKSSSLPRVGRFHRTLQAPTAHLST